MLSNKKAFTLIELLVVVLIVGILAAVAVPQYKLAVIKSRLATIQPLLASIKQSEEVYYLENGEYTSDYTKLDIDLSACSNWGGAKDVFRCTQSFGINRLRAEEMFGGVVAWYCPDSATWTDCWYRDYDFKYIFRFAHHSDKPNSIECEGRTPLGQKVCNSLHL